MTTQTVPDSDLALAPAAAKPKRPSQWEVVLLNDDFTPMDFVVRILMDVFALSRARATHVMLRVHHEGQASVGAYPLNVAKLKKSLAEEQARQERHPLALELRELPPPPDA